MGRVGRDQACGVRSTRIDGDLQPAGRHRGRDVDREAGAVDHGGGEHALGPTDPAAAVRVLDAQVERDGDALDGELAVHEPAAVAALHAGGAVRGVRVGAGVQEAGRGDDAVPVRQSALAAHFGKDSAATTRTVQRLEHAGYLRRRVDPADRRATLVEPTAAGNALRERVERIWGRLERVVEGAVPATERGPALALLEGITRAVLAELDAEATRSLTEV